MVMMESSTAHFDAFLALNHTLESLVTFNTTPSDRMAFVRALVDKLCKDHEFREEYMSFGGLCEISAPYKEDSRRLDVNRLSEMRIRGGLRCHWSSPASAG